ncbi:MAG TPA: hypothetical protein VIU93_02630 [Gallionellaceae bacterium]
MSGSPSFQGGSASSDQTAAFHTAFDSSGWTVATGGSKANGGMSNPWVIGGLAAAALLAVWLATRKR